MHGYRKSGLSR